MVVFDEFGVKDDEGKEVTEVMRNMAMEGRSDGIHLMLCTQRPDKDIVDSNLKSNLGLRIAFHTVDDTNSQIILDSNGAELIREKGRALVRTNGSYDEVQVVFTEKEDIYTVLSTVRNTVSKSTEN